MSLAAAMCRAGFAPEEVRRYFQSGEGAARRSCLLERRRALVEALHEEERRLSQVDYLLYLESR